MSYILDALKKIEHEKNKKARPDGRVSISGDLFQERQRPAVQAGKWKFLVLILLASLVTFAGTWFVFQGNSTKSANVVRPVAPPLPVSVPSPVEMRAVTPQVSPVAVPPEVPATPVAVVQKNTETVADDDSPAHTVRHPKKRTKRHISPPDHPVQTVQMVQAPAGIMLSGIAWQDERTARRAVVNGFLLKEGAAVSGAVISDIQTDRVRFSSSAGIFEIKLDAVLPAGAQR